MEDMVGMSHIQNLPDELKIKIMAPLSLNDRLHLMEAISEFQPLGQDPDLKTRVVSQPEIYLNMKDLVKVLDPYGTTIIISVDYPVTMSLTKWFSDVLGLMPNLQHLTLKSCNLVPAFCSCLEVKEWTFFDCPFIHLLLSGIKTFTLDGCNHVGIAYAPNGTTLVSSSWESFFDKLVFQPPIQDALQDIVLSNTLPAVDFLYLAEKIGYHISDSGQGDDVDISLEMTNPRETRSPVYMDKNISRPASEYEILPKLLVEIIEDIYGGREGMQSRNCLKLTIKKSCKENGVCISVRLTEEFDFDKELSLNKI